MACSDAMGACKQLSPQESRRWDARDDAAQHWRASAGPSPRSSSSGTKQKQRTGELWVLLAAGTRRRAPSGQPLKPKVPREGI